MADEALSRLFRELEAADSLNDWVLEQVQTLRRTYALLRGVTDDEFAAEVLAMMIYIDGIKLPRNQGRRPGDHRLNMRILTAWDTAPPGQKETAVAKAAGAKTAKERRAAMEQARRLAKQRAALIKETNELRRSYDQAIVTRAREQGHKSSG